MSRAHQTPTDPDDAIRSTDDDAAASRVLTCSSAISLGYLDDPFTSLLYKQSRTDIGGSSNPRKAPLINVGTHHRTLGIDILVDRFIDQVGSDAQIVSLGAGSDSRFWRLRGRVFRRYVEVDFPHLTSIKAQRIARSPKLSSLLGTLSSLSRAPSSLDDKSSNMLPPSIPSKPYKVEKGGTQLTGECYILLPLDLRSSPTTSLDQHLLPHVDPSKPVLFLAECVFCYMQPEMSREILGWFGNTFQTVAGVIYEMCGLTDTFGQVMRRNLAARNLSIPGSEPFLNVASQAARFLDSQLGNGYDTSGAKSLWEIRNQTIDPKELARISKLEHLDEIEELRLVLDHYCIAWGSKGLSSVAFFETITKHYDDIMQSL